MKQAFILLILLVPAVTQGQYFNNQAVYITDSVLRISVDTGFHQPHYKPSVAIPGNTYSINPGNHDVNTEETNKLFADNKTFDKMLKAIADSDYESALSHIDKMSGKNMTPEQVAVLSDWKLYCYRKSNRNDDIIAMFTAGNINLYYPGNYAWIGYLFANKGQYTDAVKYYEKSNILAKPGSDKAFLFSAGGCYFNLNNPSKTIDYLERYTAAGGDDSSAYYYLGVADFVQGKFDKSVDYLSKYVAKGGDCDGAFYYLGIAGYNNRQFDKSVSDFDIYIQVGGKDIEAHYYKGLAYFNLGKYDSAFASLNRYISKNGKNLLAALFAGYSSALQYYTNKGMINKLDDAIKYYTVYLTLLDATKNNNRPWIYLNRAKARIYKQDYTGAITDCDLQIKYNPGDLLAYEIKADCYEKTRNISGAIDAIDQAMKSSAANAWLYTLRARYKALNASYTAALQDIDKAVALDSKNGMIYNIRGYILLKQNKFMDAIDCYDKAIKYDPQPAANTYYYRGIAAQQLNDLQEACNDWDRAMELKVFTDPLITHADVEKMKNTYCR